MKKIVVLVFFLFSQFCSAQNVEVRLLDYLNTPETRNFGDPFFKGISSSAYILGIAVPASIFSYSLLKKNKPLQQKSIQMAVGIALSMSLTLALKYTVNRSRPGETYSFIFPKESEHKHSFPSGHTTAAFETATSLSLNFPKWYVILPAYVWAGSIGYSRMYLGVHYPSDVAGGIVLGAASAWLTWKVNQRLQRTKNIRRQILQSIQQE